VSDPAKEAPIVARRVNPDIRIDRYVNAHFVEFAEFRDTLEVFEIERHGHEFAHHDAALAQHLSAHLQKVAFHPGAFCQGELAIEHDHITADRTLEENVTIEQRKVAFDNLVGAHDVVIVHDERDVLARHERL
jgi:hypothetical protein